MPPHGMRMSKAALLPELDTAKLGDAQRELSDRSVNAQSKLKQPTTDRLKKQLFRSGPMIVVTSV